MFQETDNSKVKSVLLGPGDTLSNLAHDWFEDYSQWREIADLAGIDIFKDLPVGDVLVKPTKEEAEKKYKKIIEESVSSITSEVQTTVQEIVNSREAQTIAKLIGIDSTKLLKDLDLSNLSQSIVDQLNVSEEAWQIVSWIL